MNTRCLASLAALLLAGSLLGPLAYAREDLGGDPWAGDNENAPDEADLEAEIPDEDVPPVEPPPPGAGQLHRCRMNGLESAHYSIAELLAQRGDPKGAIAALQDVLAKTQNDTVRDTTHLNVADLHRRMGDIETASKHYREVAGILRHKAAKRLLSMLAEAGKADEMAKATDELIAKSKEKGEKLALLHRLALAYKRHRMPDRSLAVYQRITKDFTPDDLKQILEAIEKEVEGLFQKMRKLEEHNDPEALEELNQRLQEGRPRELRAAGRWDELRAFEKARDRGFRRQEQLEREREEREERGEPPAEEKQPPKDPKKAEF
jgi:tetratricopeptide (TPR) repeat protein